MIDQAQLDILKQLAESALNSESYPPSLKRRLPESFYKEGTRAAIMAFMISAIERGDNPMTALLHKMDEEKKPKEPIQREPDEFTKKALDARGVAPDPDFNDLKPPVQKPHHMQTATVIARGENGDELDIPAFLRRPDEKPPEVKKDGKKKAAKNPPKERDCEGAQHALIPPAENPEQKTDDGT